MGYGKRIDVLCAALRKAETFADVGCDHGYCSEYMLKNGLCQKAILSDISKGSLAKAESLLAPYIREGKAVAVLGDGFAGVPESVDEVLIAGMGGSEMISILSDKKHGFIPKYFVLQPMHDSEKLRRYLVENGAHILSDYTFKDGKYYDLLVGTREKPARQVCDEYTEAAFEFGRDNLKNMPAAFVERTKKQIANIEKYLREPALQEDSKTALQLRRQRLQGVLDGEIK